MGKIQTLAQQKGWTIDKKRAYGVYRGYMFTAKQESRKMKTLSCATFMPTEELCAAIEQFNLVQRRQGCNIIGHHVARESVTVAFAAGAQDIEQMSTFMDLLVDKMVELGLPGIGYCPHCGQAITDYACMVQVDEIVMQMHCACVEPYNQQVEQRYPAKPEQGNVWLGGLGALLGGLVASIPWAVAYAFGWFVGFLGFLIGLGAKKGYELFKGKTCKLKGVIVIAVTVIGVVFAEFAAIIVSFMVDPEIGVGLGEAFELLSFVLEDPKVQGELVKDILIGLLFAGLGIFSLAKDIFKSTSQPDRKALPL